MSTPSVPATCMRLAAETKGAEPHSPSVSRAFSHLSWSECNGSTLLDRTLKVSASRASCSEFLEKARAPMATEEFERILMTEREYWSTSCLQEVKALQKVVSAVQQQAASDRAEAEAVRASMRDFRAEGDCSSAAGTARMALLEAAVAELRGALRAEREQRGDELRQAGERHRAELAAARAAHESALSAALREGGAGPVDGLLAALQSDVARLQAASDDRPEEPLLRLCGLSEALEQTRGSVDTAHRRISELALGQAQSRERISCLDDAQAQALAEQGRLREAVAERTRQSQGDLQQTQEAVRELGAEVRRLAGPAREQEQGPRCIAPDTRMQDEAIEDLMAEVAWLRAASVEQARREELVAQKAERGMAELKAGLGRCQQGLERAERRVEEMAAAGAGDGSGRGADGSSDVLVSSLQRLVQDQRRELSVLSSELGELRERHESEARRSQQALGAIQASVEEERLRRAGDVEDAAGEQAATRRHQWLPVCERVAELESRLGPAPAQQQQEALPTLLTAARGAGAEADGAKPSAGASDAEAGAVPAGLKDGLKDSLQGVVAAVQKVLQDSDARRGPAVAPGAPGASASPRPAPRPARPLSDSLQGVVAVPVWRGQSQQSLVAPAMAKPLAQAPPGWTLAIGQCGRGGSIQIAPGAPLLVRR